MLAISTEWQQMLEDHGRRQANACASFGRRRPDGRHALVLLNGEAKVEVPLSDADLLVNLTTFRREFLAPSVYADQS